MRFLRSWQIIAITVIALVGSVKQYTELFEQQYETDHCVIFNTLCINDVNPLACEEPPFSGVYKNGTCGDSGFDNLGYCCTGSKTTCARTGSKELCSIIAEFIGDDTIEWYADNGNGCPCNYTGRSCCLPGFHCEDNIEQQECEDRNGIYNAHSSCASFACYKQEEYNSACTINSNSCYDLPKGLCENKIAYYRKWHENKTCAEDYVHIFVTENNPPNDTTAGRCCNDPYSCFNEKHIDECLWTYDYGLSCGKTEEGITLGYPCYPYGACIYENICFEVSDLIDGRSYCDFIGGYFFNGGRCGDIFEVLPCLYDNGRCVPTTELLCKNFGGSWNASNCDNSTGSCFNPSKETCETIAQDHCPYTYPFYDDVECEYLRPGCCLSGFCSLQISDTCEFFENAEFISYCPTTGTCRENITIGVDTNIGFEIQVNNVTISVLSASLAFSEKIVVGDISFNLSASNLLFDNIEFLGTTSFHILGSFRNKPYINATCLTIESGASIEFNIDQAVLNEHTEEGWKITLIETQCDISALEIGSTIKANFPQLSETCQQFVPTSTIGSLFYVYEDNCEETEPQTTNTGSNESFVPPEPSDNLTPIMVGAIVGGVAFVAIVAMVVYKVLEVQNRANVKANLSILGKMVDSSSG
eukprot:TRINITY_DN3356_c0_g1_i1.p1 TRINITY_DN3356_c0_g1~~TRINITY_DN3356_c0_g1_i1.p1  ORF type:complete len:650 (+),score=114.07 TRINITY_DN3356_c0_g1_i1:22-1950(+)